MHTAQKGKIIVTGGLGFIGSSFVKLALDRGYRVVNIDKMTYAARKDLDFHLNPHYEFIKADIRTLKNLPADASHIVNFAAESHVDNSIHSNQEFLKSNVEGVYNLLELVKRMPEAKRPVFIQISTDEVYGDILEGSFTENDCLHPSNPYSASKAAADMLVHAWARTYGLRTRICRSSNNYGHGQYAEKLVPKTMKMAYKNQRMHVHGDGSYKREWTFVEDNCAGVLLVLEKGSDGEIYNISSGETHTNLEVVKTILRIMGKSEDFYDLVPNRPGQDVRYSVNSDKIRALGWSPSMSLARYIPICEALNETRRKNLPPGRKQKLLNAIKSIARIFPLSTGPKGP